MGGGYRAGGFCGAVALAWWARDTWTIAAVGGPSPTVVGIGAWAASTPDQLTSPTGARRPSARARLLWSSIGSLDARLIVPTTGWLSWWIAAGLVAGAALVVGAVRLAGLIPLAAAVMVGAGWVIIRLRGNIDMSGGTWIVAGAVAFVGASVHLDQAADRRIGVTH